MTELVGRNGDRARTSAKVSSMVCEVPPDGKTRHPCRRRRIRRPAFSTFATGSGGARRRSNPATPLLRWKFSDGEQRTAEASTCSVVPVLPKHGEVCVEKRHAVTARRLACGLWQLRLPEVGAGGQMSLGLEASWGQLHLPNGSHGSCINLHQHTNDVSITDHANRSSHKNEAFASFLHFSTERATKWEPRCTTVPKEAFDLYENLKFLEDQKTSPGSVVSALRSELEVAQTRIAELEIEKQSAKKKLDHYLMKIVEEKAAWRRREHEKIRSIVDAMNEDLNRERKSRQRLETMNAKLANELTEAKLHGKRLLQQYQKERKARELIEEVCNELAKEIGDDKAQVEALKMESMKTREEVEEERKMLQMAEVWREERVQMKLIDARLTLEEKYLELSKLQEEMEAFMSAANVYNDVSEARKAEVLKEAVGSVKVHDLEQFSYKPAQATENIFSIFEELQTREEVNEKEVEQHYGSLTPELNGYSEKPMKRYDNLMFDGNVDAEDDSGWETVSHVEEQDSSKSPVGSEPSVNGVFLESQASVSGTDWEDHGHDDKQNSEISEVYSVNTRQSRKMGSSIAWLWKTSHANNSEDVKKTYFEPTNGNLCNGRASNASLSPARKSGETALSSPSVGNNWCSPDVLKSHVTQGVKGRIEWHCSSHKQRLKAKLMEASFHGQKVQLRQVLKQKI
ncbi:hypothetical protein HPP92_013680 [Vanilla planifolia]|uniref:Uncharacterized protein n=1 Tax=Vanilla planifolia TaxID=51239 RepID=A0A835V0U9_VANPL|nr:hypothetical protein HPP92_013680 [Vanilla planifolia]